MGIGNIPLIVLKEKSVGNAKLDLDVSLSQRQLVIEQGWGTEIVQLSKWVIPEHDLPKFPSGYFNKDGVLIRKCKPSRVLTSDEWILSNQIAIPKKKKKIIGLQ